MPLIATRGALSGQAFGPLSGGNSSTFVLQNHYTPAISQVVSLSGASVSNLAVVVVSNSGSGIAPTPSGWTNIGNHTWTTFGYVDSVFTKVLTSGDIATGSVTFTGLASDGTLMLVVYAGPTIATIVSTVDVTTATVTIPGFTKAFASKGVLCYVTSRSGASTPAAPAATVNRIANFATPQFVSRSDDIVRSLDYTNGATLIYTGCGTVEALGQAIELT